LIDNGIVTLKDSQNASENMLKSRVRVVEVNEETRFDYQNDPIFYSVKFIRSNGLDGVSVIKRCFKVLHHYTVDKKILPVIP